MALDHETAQRVKSVFRNAQSGDLVTVRDYHLNPLFHGTADWQAEADTQFETSFTSWLTDDQASKLTELAGAATDQAGADSLAQWFTQLLTEWASAAQQHQYDQAAVPAQGQPAASAQPRFTGVQRVEGYSGWWQGYDTAASTWLYVHSADTPTDATAGWMSQNDAYAAMLAEATPPQQAPTSGTSGELAQPAAEDAIRGALTEALGAVDGAEQLTPEQIEQALRDALQKLGS
jgi:hypothetical protein